jgi:hypothetical protein
VKAQRDEDEDEGGRTLHRSIRSDRRRALDLANGERLDGVDVAVRGKQSASREKDGGARLT